MSSTLFGQGYHDRTLTQKRSRDRGPVKIASVEESEQLGSRAVGS